MNTPAKITCTGCGQEFDLTAAYVAQYGGQTTNCPCGKALTIPSGPGAAPAVQLNYVAPARGSVKASASVWRDGGLVVLARGSRLPNRCAQCGVPVERKFGLTTLFPPGTSLSLTGFLLRRFMSDAVRVRYGYCREHMRWVESDAGRVTFIVSCAAIPAFAVAASVFEGYFVIFWACIALTMAAMAVAASFFVISKSIRIHNLDYKHVWLAGFGEEYLQHLPKLEEQRAKEAQATAARLREMEG